MVIAGWTRREAGLGPATVVPVPFEVVQQVCGNYENDHCRAQKGAPCDVRGCPFLQEGRASLVQRGPDDVDRRTVVVGGAVAAVAGPSGWA